MKNPEELLKSMPVRQPPDTLNQRMGQLFDSAAVPGTDTGRNRRAPIWRLAAAAAIGLCGGWLIRSAAVPAAPSAPAAEAVHYIVLRQSADQRDVFDRTQSPALVRNHLLPAGGWTVTSKSDQSVDDPVQSHPLPGNTNGIDPSKET